MHMRNMRKRKKRGVNCRGPLLPDERVLADTPRAARIHLHHSLKDLGVRIVGADFAKAVRERGLVAARHLQGLDSSNKSSVLG